MRKAVLLYNPHSGQRRDPRAAVEKAAAVLRDYCVEATVVATLSAAEAGKQAKAAIAQGCDTVFACGGDGTIQDVAQGVVGSNAALAILPLGTANVLAHDLGIPRDAAAAARTALLSSRLRISVGQVQCRSGRGSSAGPVVTRYFLSVAGAGQDGYLFHRLVSAQMQTLKKRTFGIAAYFAEALRVWLLHKSVWFSVDLGKTSQLGTRSLGPAASPRKATQILAVRLHNFGNLLRDLAPGASLARADFRLVLFETASRWSYLLYIIRGIVGAGNVVPGVELLRASSLRLTPSSTCPVYLEADGELLGQLPAEISIVPDALTLLIPPDFASRQK